MLETDIFARFTQKSPMVSGFWMLFFCSSNRCDPRFQNLFKCGSLGEKVCPPLVLGDRRNVSIKYNKVTKISVKFRNCVN